MLDLGEKMGAWDSLPFEEIHKQGFISEVWRTSSSTYGAKFGFITWFNIDMPIKQIIA